MAATILHERKKPLGEIAENAISLRAFYISSA
jgi:hypothetical protein